MNETNNLSLEQQFLLKAIEQQIKNLNKKESKQYLYLNLEYMLVKDNIIKFLIKNKQL
uniref:Uncharacterized protein ycf18 n=1 Tax=Dichotomaria marginata TaxID=268567 RepID=A0A1G4NS76_9FLOR|nr:Phycobilisome degradation protein [Dichotomaria marginata]SCW21513.1 Phycobilisome degradation protein [Dichotomaria marginata]